MRISAAAFFVLILAGCSSHTSPPAPNWNGKLSEQFPEPVRTALERAPQFEVLSLDPKHRDESAPTEFCRRRVVGKTTIKDPATRNRLLGAFDASVRKGRERATCFDPRHAIRVQQAGKTYYIVICFHCGNVYFYTDDVLDIGKYTLTDGSPLSVFDDILKAANVPLAEDGDLEDKLDQKP